MGEAVKNLPEEVKRKYPEAPWKGMAGMRNKVIHGYFGVDIKVIWDTVKKRIPKLKPMLEKMLKDLEKRKERFL
ncbi:MAG: HepT-like ribonuclease domain-containing protein [Candidatus Bathyarchaeia archaeon]